MTYQYERSDQVVVHGLFLGKVERVCGNNEYVVRYLRSTLRKYHTEERLNARRLEPYRVEDGAEYFIGTRLNQAGVQIVVFGGVAYVNWRYFCKITDEREAVPTFDFCELSLFELDMFAKGQWLPERV